MPPKSAATDPATLADDLNMRAAQWLYDAAFLERSDEARADHQRDAVALIALDSPVASLTDDDLRGTHHLTDASVRIVRESVDAGVSATVEALVRQTGRRRDLEKDRELRQGYLSLYAVARALAARLSSNVVRAADYKGDLQMHSTSSDGTATLASMTAACVTLGHTRAAITDHSHGLAVARGMSPAAVRRQHTEIDRLNRHYAGRFRILKGIEANITADGGIDLARDERRAFDCIVASPHSQLRSGSDQTARMARAVREPGVAILGHPTGRRFTRRAGIDADWPAVFRAAADAGVAIEIDGHWHRQDVPHPLASQALEAGCLFALDSDAHAISELRFSEVAVAHARIAGIPRDRVINCWDDEKLTAWLARGHEREL